MSLCSESRICPTVVVSNKDPGPDMSHCHGTVVVLRGLLYAVTKKSHVIEERGMHRGKATYTFLTEYMYVLFGHIYVCILYVMIFKYMSLNHIYVLHHIYVSETYIR